MDELAKTTYCKEHSIVPALGSSLIFEAPSDLSFIGKQEKVRQEPLLVLPLPCEGHQG